MADVKQNAASDVTPDEARALADHYEQKWNEYMAFPTVSPTVNALRSLAAQVERLERDMGESMTTGKAERFRKKPIVVEAMQYLGRRNFDRLRRWCGTDTFDDTVGGTITAHRARLSSKIERGDYCAAITTPEGEMLAAPGDWVIRGVKGEVYPCRRDIFAATYDSVEEA